jgi:hypothetical protein
MLPRPSSVSAGLLLLVIVAATHSIAAQNLVNRSESQALASPSALSIQPQQCVWRSGDNPAWAAPDLDESDWRSVAAWPGTATPTPFFWLRCRFESPQLAPGGTPDLQISGDLAWQVFANGNLIGASGNMVTGAHTVGLVADYPSAEFSRLGSPLLVAVRMTYTPEINGNQAFPALSLGDADFQRNAYYAAVYQRSQAQCITWICYALIASAGFFFLALYWFDRSQRYVLWISLTWLSLADLRVNEFLVASSIHYPSFLEFFLYAIGQVVPVVYVLFYFALNRKPVPRFFKFVIAVNLYDWLALIVAALLPLRASMALRWAPKSMTG